jgi:EmrB/QacA subfamily drug resistance transporter
MKVLATEAETHWMAQQPAGFSEAQIRLAVWGVSVGVFLSALDQTIVVPAVPAIAATLGQAGGDIAWIISAYLLAATAATPVIGKLSDLHGRRRVLLGSIGVFTLASVLCALAQTLWQLVAFRALQGLGGAGLMVMAHATLGDMIPPRERGRYQVYLSGMWGIASIVGPLGGGLLTDLVSWRVIFWVNLPLGILAFLLCGKALRVLPRQRRAGVRIDYAGCVLMTLAVLAWLTYLGRAGAMQPLASTPMLLLAAAGVALLAALAWQAKRATDPLVPPRLLADRVLATAFALSFTNAVLTFAAMFLLPLWFQLVWQVDATTAGMMLVPFLLGFVLFTFIGGNLARLLGRVRLSMVVALLLCMAGLLGLSSMGAGTGAAFVVLFMVLLGAGIGLIQPSITVAVMNAAEPRDIAAASSTMLLSRSLGGAFGAACGSAVLLGHLLLTWPGGPAAAPHGEALLGQIATLAQGETTAALAMRGLLTGNFSFAFLACAGVAALSALLALTIPDRPLRVSMAQREARQQEAD